MSQKVLILCGSPRKKGNTNRLAAWFADGAAGSNATVETVDAARLRYKTNGCIACMKCKQSELYECTVEDDAQPVLARMPEFDIIVMATPVYWFSPTAQLKLLMDRMFSLIKTDPATGAYTSPMTGKTLVLLSTAGGDFESGLNAVELTFRTAAKFVEMSYESLLVPNSPADPEDMEQNAALKEQAMALGRRLTAG